MPLKSPALASVVLIILSLSLPFVKADDSRSRSFTEARSRIREAFEGLLGAQEAGGNVSALVSSLNEALSRLSEAEELESLDPQGAARLASEAEALAQGVLEEASPTGEEGLRTRQESVIASILLAAGLSAFGLLAYAFGPTFLWRVWIRLRGRYRVWVRGPPRREDTMPLVDMVLVVTLAVTLGAAALIGAQAFLPKRTGEAFSELGILGPNMKLGDYPREVVAGETVKLSVYVGNHMGRAMYYAVMVKLGNGTTNVDPAPLEPLKTYERIIPDNATWVFPVYITLKEPGLNQRLLFEAWIYNATASSDEYHGRWGQLWINVTAPLV